MSSRPTIKIPLRWLISYIRDEIDHGMLEIRNLKSYNSVDINLPSNSFAEAIGCPQGEHRVTTMVKEVWNLKDHEVAELVQHSSVPDTCSTIGTEWVCRVKTDGKFTERLVVPCYNPSDRVDCGGKNATLCRLTSQYILLAVAASTGWEIEQLDKVTGFLQSRVSDKILE